MSLNDQEAVVTFWRDGTWRLWGAMDAYYAQNDEGYVTTVPLKAILDISLEAIKKAVIDGQVKGHYA